MQRLGLLLIILALTSLPMAARAQWYAGAGGGVQVARDYDTKVGVKQTTGFDSGWGALGTVGYNYGGGLRSELELSFRNANVSDVTLSPAYGGTARVYSVMVNGLYDIPVSAEFLPYVGVGAGMAHVTFNNVRTIGGSALDDSDNSPAVQGIVGFSIPLMRDISFFTQYQYQHIFDVKLSTNAGASTSDGYASSLVVAGLRWNFSAPQAAMKPLAPVAAPAPATITPAPVMAEPEKAEEEKPEPEVEKVMVFFDFNRTDITIESAAALKKVADNIKAGKAVKLELTGHADRSGSDNYNDRLSERRVEVVRRYLIRLGVAATDIDTTAKGEHDPLVETKDGERERQNRRVEILYKK